MMTRDRRLSGGQPVALTWQEPDESSRAGLQSLESKVLVNANSTRIAEEVEGMRRGTLLEEAIETGARHQWRCGESCMLRVLRITAPGESKLWGCLDRRTTPLGNPCGPMAGRGETTTAAANTWQREDGDRGRSEVPRAAASLAATVQTCSSL